MAEPVARLVVLTGAAVGAGVWLIVVALWLRMRALPAPGPLAVTARGVTVEDAERSLLELALARQWQRLARDAGSLALALPLGAQLAVKLRRGMAGAEAEIAPDLQRLDRRFRRLLGLFVVLIPLVVAGVALLLMRLVVPSELPAVRWQALQVAQIVHVLWPPFLVLFLHRRLRAAVAAAASDAALRLETLKPAPRQT
jgi:hypothetical protein